MIHSESITEQGTGVFQGELWGTRAAAWAEHEEQYRPLYGEAIRRLGIGRGTTVLDVGCGSGVFLHVAASAGARVSGLDAAAPMVEIARSRVPEADVRIGDLQFLPYDPDVFDVVTSFSSFWFAADPVEALRAAGRVAKPGAPVFALVFGRPERCGVSPLMEALAAFFPSEDAPRGKFGLHEPGVLEGMATEAGLVPETAGDLVSGLAFADDEALVRQLLSPGSVVLAARAAGEAPVREAILASMAPFRTPAGGYRLENEWRYLIATA